MLNYFVRFGYMVADFVGAVLASMTVTMSLPLVT
jgi:hypothetical protein